MTKKEVQKLCDDIYFDFKLRIGYIKKEDIKQEYNQTMEKLRKINEVAFMMVLSELTTYNHYSYQDNVIKLYCQQGF